MPKIIEECKFAATAERFLGLKRNYTEMLWAGFATGSDQTLVVRLAKSKTI